MTRKTTIQNPAIAARKVPRQQRAILMVDSILQAAAHILEEQNEPFTTNHIAARAGASIGSLYQYFPGADAIMASLMERHVADEREKAELVLATVRGGKAAVIRKLLVAYVQAHTDAPGLTARLHALAPGFGLQQQLAEARNAQAIRIAQMTGWREEDVLVSVMAVEGVVLGMLAIDPERLASQDFLDRLEAIAMAPLADD